MPTAKPAPVIAEYITIAFATTSYGPNLIDVNLPDMVREFVDTTHQNTTGHITKRRKALADLGTWNFTGQYSPDDDVPIDQGSEVVTITVGSGGTTVVFPTAMSGFTPAGTYGEVMTFTATYMVLGQISVDNGSSVFTIG